MPLFPLSARRGRELAVMMARLGVDQKWLYAQTQIPKGQLSRICTGTGGTRKVVADQITDALAAEYVRQFGSQGKPTVEQLFTIVDHPSAQKKAA
jgi:hypothetical protein